MGQMIQITDDAYNAVAPLKREGYSIKLLASNAILKEYNAVHPAYQAGEPSKHIREAFGDAAKSRELALKLLEESGGDKGLAMRKIPVGCPGIDEVLKTIEEA